jgi:hypothetical protein
VDELGVFSVREEGRVEVDTHMYRRAMQRLYGSDYVYAEGFDGFAVPEDIQVEGVVDQLTIDGSKLTLVPGASLTLPRVPFASESLYLEVESDLTEEVAARVTFSNADTGEELFSYRLSGLLLVPGTEPITATPESPVRLDLLRLVEDLQVSWSDGSALLQSVGAELHDLIVSVVNPIEGQDLGILGVLITKNRPRTAGAATDVRTGFAAVHS